MILEGTPQEILAETEKLGAEDIAEIERAEKRQIQSLEAQGRAALLSGVAAGIGSFAKGAQTMGGGM